MINCFNKCLIAALLIVIGGLCGNNLLAQSARINDFEAPHQPDIIIIKVKESIREQCEQLTINNSKLTACFNAIGVIQLQRKFPLHQKPAQTHDRLGRALVDISLIYELKLNGQPDLRKCINSLMQSGCLEYAEPKYVQELMYTPNDPSVSTQYYLNKIQAIQAWDISQSDTNVVVGVTDTGTDLNHEDLTASLKYNYQDPIDGIDNDGDGFIDNYRGWDLGENDNTPQCNANFHGLHSSGISNATVDNNKGIAGVGFKAKYLPIKISNASGALNTSYEGIVYAVDHGCQIVNCSWGGIGAGQYGQDIVDYATINNDALVIASAGNNGDSVLFYPASYRNVLSVAATDQNDHKKANSSFGTMVDVCAPGEDIVSTWINNTYVASGGTSTAAPVVSGAAAVLKSYFPNYNSVQIGELLKATADPVDTIAFNQPWAGKLGAGRINIYRALTDSNVVSIGLLNGNISDNNDNAFMVGDTLHITADFVNYLSAVSGVSVKMSTTASSVQIIDSVFTVGNMASLQTIANNSDPFKAVILNDSISNQVVEFKFIISDNAGHSSVAYLTAVINVDFININVNDVATTITSKGNIGFNNNTTQGLGFIYNGSNLLYESGLLIGVSLNRVSDRIRGTSSNDVDFVSAVNASATVPGVASDFDVQGSFNDNGAQTNAIPVKVLQSAHAWSSTGNSKYVIFKYKIINTGLIVVDNLYAGVFADWDILNSSLNKAEYDSNLRLGYCYSTQSNSLYAGIKLLSSSAPAVYYAMDNIAGGAGGIDPVGGLSSAEKYTAISSSRLNAGGSGNGNDIAHFLSSGPFTMNPNDTIEVAFAYMAGDSLIDLQNTALAAQIKYDNNPVSSNISSDAAQTIHIYPNPSNTSLTISHKKQDDYEYRLFDIKGQLLYSNNSSSLDFTINTKPFPDGMYYLQVKSSTYLISKKIVVIH
ncbi:MAG: S8 family peptidase [Bacteroidia bacterium]|nr:S8 family peptidase [Bacteroidia bacterium]